MVGACKIRIAASIQKAGTLAQFERPDAGVCARADRRQIVGESHDEKYRGRQPAAMEGRC